MASAPSMHTPLMLAQTYKKKSLPHKPMQLAFSLTSLSQDTTPTLTITTLVGEITLPSDMAILLPNPHSHKPNTNLLVQVTDFPNHTSQTNPIFQINHSFHLNTNLSPINVEPRPSMDALMKMMENLTTTIANIQEINAIEYQSL